MTSSRPNRVAVLGAGGNLPEQFLAKITNRIHAEVSGISQVFLDLTNKPPATTEWE